MRNLKKCSIKFRAITAVIVASVLVMSLTGSVCYAEEDKESSSSITDLLTGLMSGGENGTDSNALNDILSVLGSGDESDISEEQAMELFSTLFGASGDGSGDAMDFSDLFSVTEPETLSAEELKEHLDKVAAYIESVFDVSEMTVYTNDEDEGYISRSWYYEEPQNIELSDEFEVDGNKIIINKTLEKDIEDMEFEISKYEETVDPGTAESISISKDDKSFVIDLETNDTDEVMDIGDLHVTGFSTGYFLYSLSFDYCGITGDSSLEEIVRILGIPNNSIDLSVDSDRPTFTLYYGDEDSYEDRNASLILCINCEYIPDDDTASVTGLSLSWYTYLIDEE